MAQYTRAQFEALYAALATQFPDNTTGLITELIMRVFGKDISDSFVNSVDDLQLLTTASGTDTYTVAGSISAYTTGFGIIVKFTNANTGAATLNVNALGAKSIKKNGGTDVASGDINAGQAFLLVYDGTNFLIIGSVGGGGGTQDLQSVTDQGATANIGDSAANITAVNATDYAQWSLTPSNFEIASSNNANTAGATFSVDTDGAHITDTRANRGLQGGADYSANIQANDYAQKVYVDTKVASVSGTTNRITSTGGTTPAINISASYVGQSSITTTGTLTSGATGAGFTVDLGTSTITGALPVANMTAEYIIDSATPSTAGSTITLDMNNQIQRLFVGSASFATPKTLAISNTTNALVFNFHFQITNIAATLTLPSGWLMSDALFASNVWTPVTTGLYELGGSFDGTNWKIKIMGPFN